MPDAERQGTPRASIPGALSGVRVLDCTQIIAGPLAASLLSEMGADVVKVEPLEGEPWRLQAEIIPKESRAFLTQNRGKRGIAIDLKHPDAEPVRRRLIEWADVLIANYRPGVAESLKVDYESARAVKPDIIYCENTAFGKAGPYAERRGYDIIAQAISGLVTSTLSIHNGVPQIATGAPADVLTGVAMAWAISAALYHRERTGEGQAINTALLHTALFFQAGSREITALDAEPRAARVEQLHAMQQSGASIEEIYNWRRTAQPELAGNIYYRCYQTSDGFIAVGCLGPGPRARFREAMAIHDPRYEDGFDSTPANVLRVGAELKAQCEALFRAKPNAHWLALLDAHGVPCGPLRFMDELWEDEHIAANGYLEHYEHPLLGTLGGPAPIVRMSGTPTRIQRASPVLGEHTDEVMREVGLSGEEVERLRGLGVVG
jgi:formyl-CoA transferase